jgi:hypothetical protein
VPTLGGLEGCKPSKNRSFLVLVAGNAGNEHQKIEISGRRCLPEPLHRVSCVFYRRFGALLALVCLQNHIEQAGEACIQIMAAQRHQYAPALRHHANHPSFSQHFELV